MTGTGRSALLVALGAALLATSMAQQPTAPAVPASPAKTNPQIKVNFLNVCTPNSADKQEMVSAMSKVPVKVNYSGDFEVTRGELLPEKESPSKYVRLRREITGNPLFSNVQYSISSDDKNTTETLVFKVRDPGKGSKDLLLISLEDQISATAVKPATVLDSDTPATHIKVERFGKSSIALARCADADQSSYEPLFTQATKMMAQYRKALGLRTMFRSDLAWLSAPARPQSQAIPRKPGAKASSAESNAAKKHLK